MRFIRQTFTIAAKDLRIELRTKEALNASMSFAVVILLIVSFAFNPDSETMREMSGGLLWIVFAFAGALILNRSFARELPNDCLDALVASPIPGAALFLSFSACRSSGFSIMCAGPNKQDLYFSFWCSALGG
jgi:heme exporter protein B